MVTDRRRFTKEGDSVPENIKPEPETSPAENKESFARQGEIIELMRRIDGMFEAVGKLNNELSSALVEFDGLYQTLPPEEQRAIENRVNKQEPFSRDLIGFISGKKRDEHHHARPSQIGFVKKESQNG